MRSQCCSTRMKGDANGAKKRAGVWSLLCLAHTHRAFEEVEMRWTRSIRRVSSAAGCGVCKVFPVSWPVQVSFGHQFGGHDG